MSKRKKKEIPDESPSSVLDRDKCSPLQGALKRTKVDTGENSSELSIVQAKNSGKGGKNTKKKRGRDASAEKEAHQTRDKKSRASKRKRSGDNATVGEESERNKTGSESAASSTNKEIQTVTSSAPTATSKVPAAPESSFELPKGWTTLTRKHKDSDREYVYRYISPAPANRKFRSLLEVKRFLGIAAPPKRKRTSPFTLPSGWAKRKLGPYGKDARYKTVYIAPGGKTYRSLAAVKIALKSGKKTWAERRAQLESDYDSEASYDEAEEENAAVLLQARNEMEQKEREERLILEASTKSDATLLAKAQIRAAQRLAKLRVEHAEARDKLRSAHEKELEKAILRLQRADKYAYFLKPVDAAFDPQYHLEISHPMDLGTVSELAAEGKYYRRKEGLDWRNERNCKENADIVSNEKNLVFDSMGVIDWDVLLKDLNLIVSNACSYNDLIDEPGNVHKEALRLSRAIKEIINSTRSRTIKEASALMTEEELDRLQAVNQEPAMQGEWRKLPYSVRSYETISGQVPATDCDGDGVKGVPAGRGINKGREAQRVIRDLSTSLLGLSKRAAKEAEGLRRRRELELSKQTADDTVAAKSMSVEDDPSFELDDVSIGPNELIPRWLKAEGGASPVRKSRKQKDGHDKVLQRGLALGVELEVADVWGIDCHARKSIITAVEGGCKNPKAVFDNLMEAYQLSTQAAADCSITDTKKGKKYKKTKSEIAYTKQGLKMVNGILVPIIRDSPEVQETKALIATLPHSVGPKCKPEAFIEKWLLPAVNAQTAANAHDMQFALRHILAKIAREYKDADRSLDAATDRKQIKRAKMSTMQTEKLYEKSNASSGNTSNEVCSNDDKNKSDKEKHVVDMARAVLAAYRRWGDHNFRIHPKGKGVIVRDPRGVQKGHFINEYLGEVYPSWLFSERQNILDRLQNLCCGTHANVLPDFWNMQLERHPEDPYGRQLFTIDPSHRANFCSRLSHSCTPNCQTACVAISDGDLGNTDCSEAPKRNRYTVVLHSVREVAPGEELTIDYNAVTPSKNEYQLATCLCGSSGCRGSFLYLSAMDAHQQILRERHTPLQRLAMMVQACRDPRDALKSAMATLHHRAEADDMTIKQERSKINEMVDDFSKRHMPKKASSSFFLFSSSLRKELCGRDPEKYQGQVQLVAKIAGEEWRNMAPDRRSYWDEQAKIQKAERELIRKEFLAGPVTEFRNECREKVDMFEEDLRCWRYNAFRRATLWWQSSKDLSNIGSMSLRDQRLTSHGFAPTKPDGVTLRAMPEWVHVFAARILGFIEMEKHELTRRLKEMLKISSAAAEAIKDEEEKDIAKREALAGNEQNENIVPDDKTFDPNKNRSSIDDDEVEFWHLFAHPSARNLKLNEKQAAEGWLLGKGKPSDMCPAEKVIHPLIGTRVARQWGGVLPGTETTTSLGTIVAALPPEKSGDPQWYFLNAHDDGDQEELEVFEIEAGVECLSDLVESGFVDEYAKSISEEERQKALEEKRRAQLKADALALQTSLEQAAGVYDQRVSNLCVTVDRVRQMLRDSSLLGKADPGISLEKEDKLLKLSAAPLHVLTDEQVAGYLWNDENSVVRRLFRNLMEAFCLTDTAAAIKARQEAARLLYTGGKYSEEESDTSITAVQEVNLLPGVTERAKIADALFKTAKASLQAYVQQDDDISLAKKAARKAGAAKAQQSKALWKRVKTLKSRAERLRRLADEAMKKSLNLVDASKDLGKAHEPEDKKNELEFSGSNTPSSFVGLPSSTQPQAGTAIQHMDNGTKEELESLAVSTAKTATNAERMVLVAEAEATKFDEEWTAEKIRLEEMERLKLSRFQEKNGDSMTEDDMLRPIKPPGVCGDLETCRTLLRIADLVQTWAWTGDQAREALKVVYGELWMLVEGDDGDDCCSDDDSSDDASEDNHESENVDNDGYVKHHQNDGGKEGHDSEEDEDEDGDDEEDDDDESGSEASSSSSSMSSSDEDSETEDKEDLNANDHEIKLFLEKIAKARELCRGTNISLSSLRVVACTPPMPSEADVEAARAGKLRVTSGIKIDPGRLAAAVGARGGITEVIMNSKWAQVMSDLKPEDSQKKANASVLLRIWTEYFKDQMIDQPKGAADIWNASRKKKTGNKKVSMKPKESAKRSNKAEEARESSEESDESDDESHDYSDSDSESESDSDSDGSDKDSDDDEDRGEGIVSYQVRLLQSLSPRMRSRRRSAIAAAHKSADLLALYSNTETFFVFHKYGPRVGGLRKHKVAVCDVPGMFRDNLPDVPTASTFEESTAEGVGHICTDAKSVMRDAKNKAGCMMYAPEGYGIHREMLNWHVQSAEDYDVPSKIAKNGECLTASLLPETFGPCRLPIVDSIFDNFENPSKINNKSDVHHIASSEQIDQFKLFSNSSVEIQSEGEEMSKFGGLNDQSGDKTNLTVEDISCKLARLKLKSECKYGSSSRRRLIEHLREQPLNVWAHQSVSDLEGKRMRQTKLGRIFNDHLVSGANSKKTRTPFRMHGELPPLMECVFGSPMFDDLLSTLDAIDSLDADSTGSGLSSTLALYSGDTILAGPATKRAIRALRTADKEDEDVQDAKMESVMGELTVVKVQEAENWVQCENPDCMKWRKIPISVNADLLPDPWFCSMNKWDAERVSFIEFS